MLAQVTGSDWYYMAVGASFFVLAVAMYRCGCAAREYLMYGAFFQMVFIGMRLDATFSLVALGIGMSGCALAAVAAEWGRHASRD